MKYLVNCLLLFSVGTLSSMVKNIDDNFYEALSNGHWNTAIGILRDHPTYKPKEDAWVNGYMIDNLTMLLKKLREAPIDLHGEILTMLHNRLHDDYVNSYKIFEHVCQSEVVIVAIYVGMKGVSNFLKTAFDSSYFKICQLNILPNKRKILIDAGMPFENGDTLEPLS